MAPFTMDPSWQPVMSAAQRRKQRRLRSWYRHEQLTVAAALATFSHHSAPRSTTARARGGARDDVHGRAPVDAPPQEPGTQHFKLDDEDSVPELSGLRPDPVLDPGPPVVGERHNGGRLRDSSRRPRAAAGPGHQGADVAGDLQPDLYGDIARAVEEGFALGGQWGPGPATRWEGGGRGKQRRKKKLPKTSSSTSSRCREKNQGAVEHAEDGEDEVSMEKDQRGNSSSVSWLDPCDAVVDDVQEFFADEVGAGFLWLQVGNKLSGDGLQRDLNLWEEWCGSKLDSLGCFSCSWATGYVAQCSPYDTCYASFFTRYSDTVREANASVVRWRKSWFAVARMEWEVLCGSKLDSLGCFLCSWATEYATRCSSYDTCYASVLTKHFDTVREANASVVRWCKSCLVAARMECMAKAFSAVKDVTWLLFDDSLDLGLQLGRINAVSGLIPRMIKTGQLSIDDDDEKLGNDDDPKFKLMGPGGEKLHDGSHAEFVEFSGSVGCVRGRGRCTGTGPVDSCTVHGCIFRMTP